MSAAHARTARISGESPAQSRVRQNLAGLQHAYQALPMTAKTGWQMAANTLNQS